MEPEPAQVFRKECPNIPAVRPARNVGICFIAALEMPLQIFSGKASIYFGNIYLAFMIAVI